MERCKKLREYAQFIAKVRENLDRGLGIEEAINRAIEECISQGILEEILIQKLIQEERVSEIERDTEDEEYRETLYKEFRIL